MNHLLITTKLSVPTLPVSTIDRPHLYQQLDQAIQRGRRLVLISAPAGFGKSTLVSSWIKQGSPAPVAWLSLDADDNYPEIFLQYLLTAITEALPTAILPAFLPSWKELTNDTVRLILTPLVNALAQQALSLVIVLDDYHEITSQLVHNSITFLLKYLPACIQLVITSRTDPPLPLATLRARQQLYEIRMADLRFNQQEIHRFFHERWSLYLPDQVLQAISSYTEGWPVGLHLAALAVSDQSPREMQTFFSHSHEHNPFIVEYLAEEIFQHLSTTIQQFLVRTSILDRLTGDLCCVLLDDVADAPTLSDILRRNLFLEQFGTQDWYRYHQLFAQFLRVRLRQMATTQEIAALHVRASRWLIQHGFRYEALNHVVQAEAWEDALHLLTPAPPLHEILPSVHLWRRWLDMIPADQMLTRFDLHLIKIWSAVFGGDIVAAEEALNHSGMVFPEASQGNLHLLQAHIALFRGQHEQRIYEVGRALELLSPQEQPLLWALAAIIFSTTQTHYGPVHAPSSLHERAWQIGVSLADPMIMLLSAGDMSEIAFLSGKLRLCVSWLNEVRSLVTNGYTIGASYWCRVAARVAYEQNDLAQAEQVAKQGIELVRITGPRHHLPSLHIILARTYDVLHTADSATINGLLIHAQSVVQQHGRTRERAEIQAYQLRRWLAQGDRARALRWGDEHTLDPSTAANPDTHWLIVAHISLVRATLREQNNTVGVAVVERALTQALAATVADGRMNDHIRLLTHQSLLLWELGRADAAVMSLSKALALGEPEGYLRTFLDEGVALLPLLAHPLVAQAAPVLVPQLRALLVPHTSIFAASAPAPELLSLREQEILRLVAAGYSMQAIATQLVISFHTARTHLKNIYTKLDVHTRLQAVEYARARGLLE